MLACKNEVDYMAVEVDLRKEVQIISIYRGFWDGRYYNQIQMKGAPSKEKLSQMHEALDRELEQITANPRSSSASRRDREELRYSSSNIDEPKRVPLPKPAAFDHMIRDSDIRTKKNEIGDLQRKLMELERKMDNIDLSSQGEEEPQQQSRQRSSLAFREQKETQNKSNQDTARFLLEANKDRNNNKFMYSYPSLGDEQEDQEENSDEDYEEVQRAIEKKKQEAREQAGRRTVNTKNTVLPKTTQEVLKSEPQRKISTEVESVLKPKYSNEKSKGKLSQQKKSIRDSVTSKKSQQKAHPPQQQPQLNRANSKRSIKSNHSNAHSMRRSRQNSKEKHDRSFDRFSEKEDCLHSEEVGLNRDLKRMGNLERQVQHYKRLAKKYKQQLEQYRVMEIQLKELKKNFAKSELIRTQQKKVIESLRSKITK